MIARDEVLIVPDTSKDARWLGSMQATAAQSVYIGVPIRAQGRTTGVLSILRPGEQIFSIDEITFISALANHIGVIIENNRLIERMGQISVTEERARLARELHDSVTQTLYSAAFFAEAGREMAEKGDLVQVAGYLRRLAEITQQALKEMRLLIYQLRPGILEKEGLSFD